MKPIQLFDPASSTYTYLLFDAASREALIIDPVDSQLERDLAVLRRALHEMQRHLDNAWLGRVDGLPLKHGDAKAMRALREAKGRGDDLPVGVLVGAVRTVDGLASGVTADGRALIDAFWPGPLTLVLPRRAEAVELGGLRFTVMLTRGGAVRWFRVARAPQAEGASEGGDVD